MSDLFVKLLQVFIINYGQPYKCFFIHILKSFTKFLMTIYKLFLKTIFIFVFASIVLLNSAKATNYLVSSASHISSVMSSQAHAGDTLTMTSGTWTNQLIVFQGNGTSTKPILMRSQGGYGSVILTGTSTLRIAGNYLIVDGLKFQNGYSSSGSVIEFRNSSSGIESNYSRLTNSAVLNYNPSNDSTDYKWVSLYGTHNRVDHCHLEGKTHSGTTLVVWRATTAADYHQIDHNYFGPRPVLGYNGGESIRVGTSDQSLSSSYTIVEYNLFDRCNGEIECISNKSCYNTYRYNTFISCQATLTLRHGNHCLVEGNFFFGNHEPNSGGIRIIGEDHTVINNYISGTDGSSLKSALTLMDGIPNSPLSGYYQVKRALVAFNTLVDNKYSINLGGGKDADNILPPLDCTIANNIAYGTYSPLITQTDSTINTTWQSNIFFGASLGVSPIPPGITITDPKLAAVGTDGIRHIESNSPAINASQGTYTLVTLDMDGQTRDLLKDIGADEYSGLLFTQRPLTINDVGPNATSYQIAVSQNGSGTVSPGTVSVRAGESQRFVFTPSNGFHLDSLFIDGAYFPDSTNGYTFKNVLSAHTISVKFVANIHQIMVGVHGPGIAIPSGSVYVNHDANKSFSFIPNADCHIDSVVVDGISVDSLVSYTIYNVQQNHEIDVYFSSNIIIVSTEINNSWNLVSVPVWAQSFIKDSVFQTAISNAYTFNAGYVAKDTLQNGVGYWLKFPSIDTLSITGVPIYLDTIDVQSGWNLIGSISSEVSVTLIATVPDGILTSSFYGYKSGYVVTPYIKPGKGYWIKVKEAGKLILGLPGKR
jgi:poly(beta-D-mannuronate) lyase